MKTFILAALTIALPAFAAQKAPAPLDEGRCFDIKQSVLADLPHFCGKAKSDKARLEDFGHQIDLLEKRCSQPQLAHLFRKALDERVNKESASGCTAAAEKAVLPAKARAAAAGEEL
jgi:hypothetical protein